MRTSRERRGFDLLYPLSTVFTGPFLSVGKGIEDDLIELLLQFGGQKVQKGRSARFRGCAIACLYDVVIGILLCFELGSEVLPVPGASITFLLHMRPVYGLMD